MGCMGQTNLLAPATGINPLEKGLFNFENADA